MILRDIVEKFGTGVARAATGFILFGVMNLHGDEAAGVGVGERLHQDVFNDAEDRGGSANAEGQRDGSDDGEGRTLAQVADGEADVLAERAHEVPPGLLQRV